jgi:hypothetical protein
LIDLLIGHSKDIKNKLLTALVAVAFVAAAQAGRDGREEGLIRFRFSPKKTRPGRVFLRRLFSGAAGS